MIVQNPEYQTQVQECFDKHRALETLGVLLRHVAPGEVDLELPFNEAFGQQDGFLHAGIITTVVDSACGMAALTLMPPHARVLTVEYKVNFMRPAVGEKMVCRGRVKKPGKTIPVTEGEVIAHHDGREKSVAIMTATMITVMPT